jgi:hypothetical protein
MSFSEKNFLGMRFLEILFPENFKRIIFGSVFGLLEIIIRALIFFCGILSRSGF